MTGRKIHVKGFKLKDGRVIRDLKQYDASMQRRIAGSKKVRVSRKPRNEPAE